MCADCAAEQRDPSNRRYRHAFVNCTNCGPRFTIIASLPYDRASTTMASFAMCAACAHEYADPTDRRFHAQPVCCPNCGPALRYRDGDGGMTDGDGALLRARRLLRDGGILASRESADTTWPATPMTSRRSPSCGGESGAGTSRSR